MTTIEDLRLQYFEDCKEIIADLQKIDSETDLIDQKVKLDTLVEKIAFLKHCSQNISNFTPPIQVTEEEPNENDLQVQNEIEEQRTAFNFEIAGPSTQEVESQYIEPEHNSEPGEKENIEAEFLEQTQEDYVESKTRDTDIELVPELEASSVLTEDEVYIEESASLDTKKIIEEESETFEPLEASAESIVYEETKPLQEVEVEKENEQEALLPTETQSQSQAHKNAKKIKLAHIKGLTGSVHSLFDDEELDEAPSSSHSRVASKNILEIETPIKTKERSHFKLDLNDRIAFTKILFDGSQSELNHTVNELNEFQNLEEAKDYLSQVYHKRGWKKVDEYAQRLWMLVENKFQ